MKIWKNKNLGENRESIFREIENKINKFINMRK